VRVLTNQHFDQVELLRPGWTVMLAKRNVALPAAFFCAFVVHQRHLPGFSVVVLYITRGVMLLVNDGSQVMRLNGGSG
jgi:hypothetical protein